MQRPCMAVLRAKTVRHFSTLYMTAVACSDAMRLQMEGKNGGRNILSYGEVLLVATRGGKPELGEYKIMIPGMP